MFYRRFWSSSTSYHGHHWTSQKDSIILCIYYITKYYILYIILLYNTLLCTVRIQIHYCFPGCSYCSCYFYCLYYYNVLGFPERFPIKKGPKDCQSPVRVMFLLYTGLCGFPRNIQFFLLLLYLAMIDLGWAFLIGWVMKKFLDLEKYLL